jgi:hypothetical protein
MIACRLCPEVGVATNVENGRSLCMRHAVEDIEAGHMVSFLSNDYTDALMVRLWNESQAAGDGLNEVALVCGTTSSPGAIIAQVRRINDQIQELTVMSANAPSEGTAATLLRLVAFTVGHLGPLDSDLVTKVEQMVAELRRLRLKAGGSDI